MLTQVSGTKVLDEFGQALTAGEWSFSNENGVTSFAVTDGAFSGQLAPYIWLQCPPSGVPAQGTNYPGINDPSGNSPGYPSGY